MEAAADTDLKLFVQISTDEVYGEIHEGKFSESDGLDPQNPYAATKAGAGLLAQSYHASHDVPVVITRSSNNYGPRQHSEKFIPLLVQRLSSGEPFPLYGDGTQTRDWIFVTDNCRTIYRVIEEGTAGEVYNVAAQNERQNLEVVERVLELVGASEDLVEHVEDRPAHDQRYALETDDIKSLGWEPRVDFETGLRRTVDFYR